MVTLTVCARCGVRELYSGFAAALWLHGLEQTGEFKLGVQGCIEYELLPLRPPNGRVQYAIRPMVLSLEERSRTKA